MAIKASERIIQKIKEFEAFVPKPEEDYKTGKTAIGYGNTHVKRANTTPEQAEADLRNHVTLLEQELSNKIKRQDLSQNKQDVLIDKAYNLGVPKMSKFIDRVNAGDDVGAGRSIPEYAYTTDAITKQKIPLKGLAKRAAYREQLWNSPDETNSEQIQKLQEAPVATELNAFTIDPYVMSDIDRIATEVLTPSVPPGGVDRYASVRSNKFQVDEFTMGEIDSVATEVLNTPQEAAVPADNKAALDSMAEMTNGNPASQYLLKRSEAERISKGTGVSLMEAKALLDEYTPEEILSRNAHAITAKLFPAVSEWGKDQDNYVLMRQTGDTVKKIEVKARALSKDNEFSKAGQLVGVQLKRASIHALMATEAIDKNQGKQMLRDLDAEARTLSPVENIKERKAIAGYRQEGVVGTRELLKGEILSGGMQAAEGYIKYIASYISSPSLYAQDMVKNAASFVPTIITMTGGIITSSGAGAAVGLPIVAAGTSLTGLLAFGGSMDEELQKFTDENGDVDYDRAYGDIEFLTKARQSSVLYTGVMMASDLILGKVAGRIGTFKNPITGQVFAKKGVTNVVKRVAATSAIGEGGSEFAGSGAKSAYKGTFVQDLPENTFKSFEESFMSPGMAGVIAGTTATPRLVQRGAKKLISKIQRNAKAVDGAETLKSTREEVKSTPETAQAKTQMADLIDESVRYKGNAEDIYTSDTEAPSEGELKEKAKSITEGTLLFSPSEFDAAVTEAGFDPAVIIQNLSPEVQQAYYENRESDDRVTVKMGEWATFAEDDALGAIDDIAYFPDSFVNGKEAKQEMAELSKNPLAFLNVELPPTPDQEEDVPPPLPQEGDVPPPLPKSNTNTDLVIEQEDLGPIQIIDPTSPEGNIVSRPIQLISKGLRKSEEGVLKKIVIGIKRAASRSKDIDVKHAEALAKIQFDHLKFRSEVLNVPLKDLANTNYGMMSDNVSIEIENGVVVSVTHGSHTSSKLQSEDVKGITKILLAKSAKLNTVIHELGHNWLHDLARDSHVIYSISEDELTEAQRDYKLAMKDTAEMFGLESMRDLYTQSDANILAIHEKFAQTAEMYFLEGKFENNKFRIVMEHLRQGLLKIIDIVGKAYPEYKPLGINPKVERVFETILRASTAVEDAVLPLIEEPMFPVEMLGAQGPKYMDVIAAVEREAIGQIYTDSILTQEKQREAEGIRRLAEFRAKAEAQVDELPAFSLMKVMQDNYAAYIKNGKKGTDPRFSFESVAEFLFNGDEDGAMLFKKAIPTGIISGKKKGGMDIGNWMAEARIADPNEMIEAIAEMTNREMRVDEVVDGLVDEAMPSIKTDEEIHAKAEEAVQNSAKQDRLNMEMDLLVNHEFPTLKGIAAKLINPARYVGSKAKEAIKSKAFTKVMKSPAGLLVPKNLLVNSDKHGRDASKLFKSKAIVEAIESKYKQMIDFKAYEYAQSAFAKIAKTDKSVKKIMKYAGRKEAASAYDVEVLNEGKRIIIEAVNGTVSPMDITTLHELSGMNPDMVKEINSYIDSYNNLTNGKGSKFNTVQARIAMGDLLSKVISSSRKARGAERSEKITQEDIAVEELVSSMEGYNGVIDLTDTIRNAPKASLINVYWLFEALNKDFFKSRAFKILGSLRNSEGNTADNKKEYKKKIVELYNNVAPPNIRNAKEAIKALSSFDKEKVKEVFDPFLSRLGLTNDKPIVMSGLGVTYKNEGERLKAMLLMGSNSGAINYLGRNTNLELEYDVEGNAVDAGQVNTDVYKKDIQDAINRGEITKAHIDFLNGTWAIFNELHPLMKEAMRYTDNYAMGEIKASPMEFDMNGEKVILTGGYAPITADPDLSSNTGSQDFLTLDSNGVSALALKHEGITKERRGSSKPIDLNISTLLSYINHASDIAYLRKDMSDLRRILMRPEIEAVIEKKAPGAYKNVIKPWFKDAASQVFTEYSGSFHNKASRYMRKGANTALYSLSIPNAMIQQLGFIQSYNRLKKINDKNTSKYLLAGFTQGVLRRKSMTTPIMEKSAVMRERRNTSILEQHRSISFLENTQDWVGNTLQISGAIAGFLSQASQQFVDEVTWTAAYLSAKDTDMSDDQARNVADDTVIRSQGSMLPTALSNVQRGTDMVKLVMAASNVKVITANEIGLSLSSDVQGNPMKAKVILGTIAMSAALPFVIEQIARKSIKAAFDDEEDEDKIKARERKENMYLAANVAGNITGLIYAPAGNVLESVIAYNNTSISAGFSQLAKIGVAGTGARNILRGVDTSAREKRAILDTFTFLTHRPEFSMVGRMMGANELTKTSEELEEEKYTRQYQLEDLREDLY